MSESKKNPVFRYAGVDVDVLWDRRLCIHIGECGRAEGDLFVGGRKPWCDPNVADAENAAEVCERCPTGALTYEPKNSGATEVAKSENTVSVANSGPLYVVGDLDVAGAADDMEGVQFRVALCRCGQSKNKPFCDNSHEAAGFKDYGAVGSTGDGGTDTGGKLQVNKVPDGPLLLSGNFSIRAASGRLAWSGTKAALCRCGASKNKPFCDGAHKDAGFKAD